MSSGFSRTSRILSPARTRKSSTSNRNVCGTARITISRGALSAADNPSDDPRIIANVRINEPGLAANRHPRCHQPVALGASRILRSEWLGSGNMKERVILGSGLNSMNARNGIRRNPGSTSMIVGESRNFSAEPAWSFWRLEDGRNNDGSGCRPDGLRFTKPCRAHARDSRNRAHRIFLFGPAVALIFPAR